MSESIEPPTSINPYSILSLSKSASPAEIKSAYKKLALRLHPDKVPHADRSNAHTQFQELALAYAILSDPHRKRRYDATGSTADSLDLEDDDFDWTSFFRAQYADLVTVDKIRDFRTEYQGSEEEKQDVLTAYTAAKGKMKGLFERVMMSNMLADEERFRQIIDESISNGSVEGYSAYLNETTKQKEKRRKQALKEQQEAEEHAKELGIHSRVYEPVSKENEMPLQKTEKAAASTECDLAAPIQQRVKGRMENFMDNLEEKYASKPKNGGRGKKNRAVVLDEPPDVAFEAMAKRSQRGVTKGDELASEGPEHATQRSKKRSAEVLEDEVAREDVKPKEFSEETEFASKKKRKKKGSRKRPLAED